MMLASTDEFEICADARNGREAVRAYIQHKPSITLMDLQMPEMSGPEAIAAICRRDPRAVIVALTTFGTRSHVVQALKAGASGYLLKNLRAHELLDAMRHALSSEMPLSSSIRKMLVTTLLDGESAPKAPEDVGLTPRELDVLGCLSEGLNNVDIASRLYVSEGSVKQYLSHIGDKLGVRSRTQILVVAMRKRLIDPETGKPADVSTQSKA